MYRTAVDFYFSIAWKNLNHQQNRWKLASSYVYEINIELRVRNDDDECCVDDYSYRSQNLVEIPFAAIACSLFVFFSVPLVRR